MRAARIFLLAVVVIVACLARADASPGPLWGELRPGPHAVGFRVVFASDTTRAWQSDQQTVSGRPVRVSLWYPARVRESARPTPYRSYVVIGAPGAYASYNEALVRRNLAGLAAAVPGQGLEELLNTPTAAYLNAPHARERFPLVVYLSGLNESGQHANSVLCEYLASHGFVVAAIPQVGTTHARLRLGVNLIDLETQARDAEFAVAEVRRLMNVEEHWAIVGHSIGGIVALIVQARQPSVAAIVGLDASYGNAGLQSSLRASPYFQADRFRIPLLDLRRASPPADFSVVESLVYSERIIGELPNVAHGDFTTFPMIAALVPTTIEGRTVEDARRGYQVVVRTTTEFLRAVLVEGRLSLTAPVTGGASPVAWRVIAAEPAPPTEEEFVAIVEHRGVAEATRIYRTYQLPRPDRPIVNERRILSLGYDFLEPPAQPARAIAVFRFLTEINPSSADWLDSLAEAYVAAGDINAAASTSHRVLAALDRDVSLTEHEKAALRRIAEERIALSNR